MRETNTLLKTSRSLKSGQGASDLIKECVAETGGGRCARYARESLAGCERRAYGAGEAAEPPRAQQRATESTSGAIIRNSRRQDPFRRDSKEPQGDIQDYLKGEVRFASVAKQFPNEAAELFAAAQENAQWRYKSYLRMLGTAW